jgi:glucose dehydrogenase
MRPVVWPLPAVAVVGSGQDWPKSGGDFSNRNYSTLTQINRENVGALKGVWRRIRRAMR